MAIKVVCDFCDKPLEVEDGRCVFYRTKQLDTRKTWPHLCKNCANELDNLFAQFNMMSAAQAEAVKCMNELNKERREKLGTKG